MNNLTNYQKYGKNRKLKRQITFDFNNNNDEQQENQNVSDGLESAFKKRREIINNMPLLTLVQIIEKIPEYKLFSQV